MGRGVSKNRCGPVRQCNSGTELATQLADTLAGDVPHFLPLTLLDAGMRGMVLALALLLAVLLARQPGPQPPALRAAMLLCLGLAVQVPSSSPWVEHELGCTWQTPLIALSVAGAARLASRSCS